LLAFVIMLVQAALAFYIAPLAMKELKIRTAQNGSSLALAALQAGAFKEIKSGMTVYAAAQGDGGVWQNVMIHDRSNEARPITYTAREGVLSNEGGDSYFVLSQGAQHIKSERGHDVLNFTQYVLPLSEPASQTAKPLTFNRNHMMIHQLLDPAAHGVTYAKKITRMKSRGLELISNLAAPFVFMLISFAAITSGGINRHGYGRRVMVAVALALVFQIGVISVAAQAVEADNPMLVFIWPVSFIAALLGTIFWQNDRYGVIRFFKRVRA
jgi:lipopolysaccharide export system permease protein